MREIPARNWELRELAYNLFHRWTFIVGAIILGAFSGYILSLAWPAHYRASSQVYLGLNAYRRYSDTIFEALANPKYSNLDNYQYWQMSQLEAAVFLDRFLEPTLEELREEDTYWQSVEIDQLRNMFSSEWRTTGAWNLIADHKDPNRANQAVNAWSAVAVDQIKLAVDAAREMILIDHQLRAGETELLQTRLRKQSLVSTQIELDKWLVSSSIVNHNQPPEPNLRWEVYSLVSSIADFSPAWLALLEKQPGPYSPSTAYVQWVEETKNVIAVEMKGLDRKILELESLTAERSNAYALESKTSLSFSPNIEIEKMEEGETRIVRPTATFVMVGSVLGLLVWLLFQLSLISESRRNR